MSFRNSDLFFLKKQRFRNMPCQKQFTIILLALLTCVAESYAQPTTGTIKGVLLDSASHEALPLGTISAYRLSDTSILTYRMSDDKGVFKLTNIPGKEKIRLIISYSGYRVLKLELGFDSTLAIDLGQILMSQDSSSLDEVLVYAERPPVVIRKDTIEFNVSAFRTFPNALLEDLLKKLPGVRVDRAGSITVNGVKVSRILVNKKEFFGDDVRMATRNLPSDIIEKVQVSDDIDTLNSNPGLPRGNISKVINLKLKKGVNKGAFGKLYAGAGSDRKYEIGGIVNYFKDTLQLSVLSYSNNINRSGFSMDEINELGGFRRGGGGSSMQMSNGAFALGGISFGATSDGIQTSSGAGININHVLAKKVSLNLKYIYGEIKSTFEEITDNQQFYGDTLLLSSSIVKQRALNYAHNVSSNIKWDVTPQTVISIRPSLRFNGQNSSRVLNTDIRNNQNVELSQVSGNLSNFGNSYSVDNETSVRHLFKKRKNNLTITSAFSLSNNKSKQYNESNTQVFFPTSILDTIDQLRSRNLPNFRLSVSAAYSDPISTKLFFRIVHEFVFTGNKEDFTTFSKNRTSNFYDIFEPVFSNGIGRKLQKNTSTVSLTWLNKKLNITPSIGFQNLAIKNKFNISEELNQHYNFFAPGLSINLGGFYFNFLTSFFEPRLADIQPTVDNSNPLYLRVGNPNLKPMTSRSAYFTYFKYLTKHKIQYSIRFNPIFDNNGIVFEQQISSDGTQLIIPRNVRGIQRFNGGVSFDKEFPEINKSTFNLQFTLYSTYNRAEIVVNRKVTNSVSVLLRPTFAFNLNINDKFELNQQYEISYSEGRYDSEFSPNVSRRTHTLTTDILCRPFKAWTLESSLDYVRTPEASIAGARNITIWNVGLSYLFLKSKKGSLKISAYDILNQNKSVGQIVNQNFITNTKTQALTRFLLLTFVYNLRDIKVEGSSSNRSKLFYF